MLILLFMDLQPESYTELYTKNVFVKWSFKNENWYKTFNINKSQSIKLVLCALYTYIIITRLNVIMDKFCNIDKRFIPEKVIPRVNSKISHAQVW